MNREDVRNLILGYPSLKNKHFGTFLGEIHRINPEILGYPRIPSNNLPCDNNIGIGEIRIGNQHFGGFFNLGIYDFFNRTVIGKISIGNCFGSLITLSIYNFINGTIIGKSVLGTTVLVASLR